MRWEKQDKNTIEMIEVIYNKTNDSIILLNLLARTIKNLYSILQILLAWKKKILYLSPKIEVMKDKQNFDM